MASPETNSARIRLGFDPLPPDIMDPPFPDPATPIEYIDNAIVVLHNQAELGKIGDVEAARRMHDLEEMRNESGDGWADRYGPLPEY